MMSASVSKDKTRINITIDRELKQKAEDVAKSENRSLSNLISYALKLYIESQTH